MKNEITIFLKKVNKQLESADIHSQFWVQQKCFNEIFAT